MCSKTHPFVPVHCSVFKPFASLVHSPSLSSLHHSLIFCSDQNLEEEETTATNNAQAPTPKKTQTTPARTKKRINESPRVTRSPGPKNLPSTRANNDARSEIEKDNGWCVPRRSVSPEATSPTKFATKSKTPTPRQTANPFAALDPGM